MAETLPGNPHAWNLSRGYSTEAPADAATCQIEATLALAFEQRTATLLQLAIHQDRAGKVGDAYFEQVAARLGLDGDGQ